MGFMKYWRLETGYTLHEAVKFKTVCSQLITLTYDSYSYSTEFCRLPLIWFPFFSSPSQTITHQDHEKQP